MTVLQFNEFIASSSCLTKNNSGANYSSSLLDDIESDWIPKQRHSELREKNHTFLCETQEFQNIFLLIGWIFARYKTLVSNNLYVIATVLSHFEES